MNVPSPFEDTRLKNGRAVVYTVDPPFDVLAPKQIHSPDVVTTNAFEQNQIPKADGLVQFFHEAPLRPMAVVTADCIPIIIVGKEGVATLHAGWRGLAGGILEHHLVKQISPLQAWLGPHIRRKNYEVGPDFSQNFPNSPHITQEQGYRVFDLTAEARDRLLSRFPKLDILDSGHNTYGDKALHSYRRDVNRGRNWNLWIPDSFPLS